MKCIHDRIQRYKAKIVVLFIRAADRIISYSYLTVAFHAFATASYPEVDAIAAPIPCAVPFISYHLLHAKTMRKHCPGKKELDFSTMIFRRRMTSCPTGASLSSRLRSRREMGDAPMSCPRDTRITFR
jgi:hypothetical protein